MVDRAEDVSHTLAATPAQARGGSTYPHIACNEVRVRGLKPVLLAFRAHVLGDAVFHSRQLLLGHLRVHIHRRHHLRMVAARAVENALGGKPGSGWW